MLARVYCCHTALLPHKFHPYDVLTHCRDARSIASLIVWQIHGGTSWSAFQNLSGCTYAVLLPTTANTTTITTITATTATATTTTSVLLFVRALCACARTATAVQHQREALVCVLLPCAAGSVDVFQISAIQDEVVCPLPPTRPHSLASNRQMSPGFQPSQFTQVQL